MNNPWGLFKGTVTIINDLQDQEMLQNIGDRISLVDRSPTEPQIYIQQPRTSSLLAQNPTRGIGRRIHCQYSFSVVLDMVRPCRGELKRSHFLVTMGNMLLE